MTDTTTPRIPFGAASEGGLLAETGVTIPARPEEPPARIEPKGARVRLRFLNGHRAQVMLPERGYTEMLQRHADSLADRHGLLVETLFDEEPSREELLAENARLRAELESFGVRDRELRENMALRANVLASLLDLFTDPGDDGRRPPERWRSVDELVARVDGAENAHPRARAQLDRLRLRENGSLDPYRLQLFMIDLWGVPAGGLRVYGRRARNADGTPSHPEWLVSLDTGDASEPADDGRG